MKRILSPLIAVYLFSTIGTAQDLNYARSIVGKLASEEFKGRGYVNKGDQKAAEYIALEFEKIGLQKYGKSYFQRFTTSVNTFPNTVQLSIDNQALTPGADFLVEPGSPSVSGEFSVLPLKIPNILDREIFAKFLRNASGKFLLFTEFDRNSYNTEDLRRIDDVLNFLKYHPDNPTAGTLISDSNKLTWSASSFQYSKPTFTIRSEMIDESINEIEVHVQSKLAERYKTQNVAGYIEGVNQDSLIVFIAHYDHLGMMGTEAIFPGANDNASGIAMLLNLAKHYQENTPKHNTAFLAFAGEELGLLGSKHFVENPFFDLQEIKFLINFDISGTGDEGIQVVNGSVHRKQFDRLAKINEEKSLLPQVKIRGAACNSDHCMFDSKGIPNFFIYTLGGIQAYHDIYDKAETLPLTRFEDYFKLIVQFVNGFE
ncbi:MAG: M20/M25/M40 family metallo-hydrolase [Cyclobacteriaceae bacterium]